MLTLVSLSLILFSDLFISDSSIGYIGYLAFWPFRLASVSSMLFTLLTRLEMTD